MGCFFTEGEGNWIEWEWEALSLPFSLSLSLCGRGEGVGRRLCGAEGQAHQPLLSIRLDKDAWENFSLSEATPLLRNIRSKYPGSQNVCTVETS